MHFYLKKEAAAKCLFIIFGLILFATVFEKDIYAQCGADGRQPCDNPQPKPKPIVKTPAKPIVKSTATRPQPAKPKSPVKVSTEVANKPKPSAKTTKTDFGKLNIYNMLAYGKGKVLQNSLGMEFAYVPAGEFMMGTSENDVTRWLEFLKTRLSNANRNWFQNETPQYLAKVPKGFWLGRFEITQGQWKKLMEENPSYFQSGKNRLGNDDKLPVESVSWEEANDFISKLNQLNDGIEYSLPTEIEWEYAAQSGIVDDFAGNDLYEVSWFGNNSGKAERDTYQEWQASGFDSKSYTENFINPNGNQPHPVGTKKPNKWNLHDMNGNVKEWCGNIWAENYQGFTGKRILPKFDFDSRPFRGGSWYDPSFNCRSTYRGKSTKTARYYTVGLRVAAQIRG